MGNIQTVKYVRKPLYVEAIQVTNDNFLDVVKWCQALVGVQGSEPGTETHPAEGVELDPSKHYIRVRVTSPMSQRQTKAFVGDWILFSPSGYKIYTDKAFKASFDEATPESAGSEAPAPQPVVE